MVPDMHSNIDVTTIEPDLVVRDVTDGGAITVAALIQGFTNSRFRRAAQGQQCQESDRFHCQCWIIYDEPSACESESCLVSLASPAEEEGSVALFALLLISICNFHTSE